MPTDRSARTEPEESEISTSTLQQMIANLVKIVTVQQSKLQQGGGTRGITGISFDRYNEDVEDFDTYIERLSAFFEVQGVPDERKVSCFVSLIGPKLFTLLKNLLHPGKYTDKSFEELKTLLQAHLNPTPLVIPSRHAFLNRKQHEGESLAVYMAELRRLALPCKYNSDMLNTMLRDVFVSGLRSKVILDRVFENDDITLEQTLQLAFAIEKATSGASEILHSEQPNKIHRVGSQKSHWKRYEQTNSKPKPRNDLQCLRCARQGHSAGFCKAKNLFCKFCKRKNHVEAVCFRKKADQNVKEVNESTDETNADEPLPLYAVYDNKRVPPMIVPVSLNGKTVPLEVDTGAAATIINRQVFNTIPSLQSGILRPTSTSFKSYNQQQITPLGEAVLKVSHNSITRNLRLFVVNDNYSNIMGREWISALEILPIPVNLVSDDKTLNTLLSEYSQLFEKQVNAVQNYTYSVELQNNAKPVFKRARPVPFMLMPAVEKELQRLENDGIITKTTISDWATPIVPVRKPNGDIRICGDYSCTINPQIKVPRHPFPTFEEVSAKLNGGQAFSICDVTTAFLHLPVCHKSSKILTIHTHKGLYNVNRLLFGCSSAPAVWQRYIESVLKDLPGVIVVHDDIIVTGYTEKQHLEHLANLFKRLLENGIRLNPAKCKFLQKEVKFLGYRISSEGVKKTTERIDAIMKCKTPTCVKDVQSFMGMVNFYAKFAKNLATLSEPLYQLTRSNTNFEWKDKHEKSFNEIKEEIASDKILMHYDPKLPLVLSVDASPVGLAAILAHRIGKIERPIAFASRTLNASERNYSQIDKEATAIKWGVDKFYNYLFANRFILITDHQPLFHIFGRQKRSKLPSHTATRLLHYAIYLQMFDFDIEYRRSENHGNVDFLSRLPLNSKELGAEDQPTSYDAASIFNLEQINTIPILPKDIQKATLEDEETRTIYEQLQLGVSMGPNSVQYSLQRGCIFNGIRVYIPKSLRPKILQELHDGHLGIVKMKTLARSVVYWPKIDQDIETTCKNCYDCVRIQRQPSKVEKHFWEYPSHPWERIHCDFAGPFMGHMFFLIVDAHSKWLETFIVKSTSSKDAIQVLESLFARYGLPRTLVSDNGTAFTSHHFQTFMKIHAIKHITTAPFHPASNGEAERYVFTLKQALRAMKNHEGGLQHRLNVFLMTYRRTPNITTGESPAKLFFQREIRTKIDLLKPDPVRDVADRLRKNNLTFTEKKFTEGELVAVRDYRSPDKRWTFGRVVSQDGNIQYTVSVDGQLWRRHVEQMRRCGPLVQEPVTSQASATIPSVNFENRRNVFSQANEFNTTPDKIDDSLGKQNSSSSIPPRSSIPASPRKTVPRRSIPQTPAPRRSSPPTPQMFPEEAKNTSVTEPKPKQELRRSAREVKKPIRFRSP